jgi:hypothetical protein
MQRLSSRASVRELIISSDKRNSGSNEDFYVTLDSNILPSRIKSVKLLNCFIPFTWYPISSSNNTIVLSEQASPLPAPITISLSQQYYDAYALSIELQEKLIQYSRNSLVYTVVFDVQSHKFVITASNEFTLNFTTTGTCYRQLGFERQSYVSSSRTITSPNIISFVDDRYVYIHSNLIGGIDNGVQVVTGSSAVENNILGAVPIKVGFTEVIIYEGSDSYAGFIDSTNSSYNQSSNNSLHFWLSLSSGQNINLNGHYWSIKLLVEY